MVPGVDRLSFNQILPPAYMDDGNCNRIRNAFTNECALQQRQPRSAATVATLAYKVQQEGIPNNPDGRPNSPKPDVSEC